MADLPAKAEIGVTTGPIRGSKKIHVGPLKVAMREIALEPTSGEPPVRVYDTSGPYTDPDARIDLSKGLPRIRAAWLARHGLLLRARLSVWARSRFALPARGRASGRMADLLILAPRSNACGPGRSPAPRCRARRP